MGSRTDLLNRNPSSRSGLRWVGYATSSNLSLLPSGLSCFLKQKKQIKFNINIKTKIQQVITFVREYAPLTLRLSFWRRCSQSWRSKSFCTRDYLRRKSSCGSSGARKLLEKDFRGQATQMAHRKNRSNTGLRKV